MVKVKVEQPLWNSPQISHLCSQVSLEWDLVSVDFSSFKSLNLRYHKAIFYIFLLGFICFVPPIVWVSEGHKPCLHQPQIKHSSWPAKVCDLCSFNTSNTGGGTQTLFMLHCVVSCVKPEKPSQRGSLSFPLPDVQSDCFYKIFLWHQGWSVNAWMFKQQKMRNSILSMQNIVCEKRLNIMVL